MTFHHRNFNGAVNRTKPLNRDEWKKAGVENEAGRKMQVCKMQERTSGGTGASPGRSSAKGEAKRKNAKMRKSLLHWIYWDERPWKNTDLTWVRRVQWERVLSDCLAVPRRLPLQLHCGSEWPSTYTRHGLMNTGFVRYISYVGLCRRLWNWVTVSTIWAGSCQRSSISDFEF